MAKPPRLPGLLSRSATRHAATTAAAATVETYPLDFQDVATKKGNIPEAQRAIAGMSCSLKTNFRI
jgi:hypothetical protein